MFSAIDALEDTSPYCSVDRVRVLGIYGKGKYTFAPQYLRPAFTPVNTLENSSTSVETYVQRVGFPRIDNDSHGRRVGNSRGAFGPMLAAIGRLINARAHCGCVNRVRVAGIHRQAAMIHPVAR